jgi:hypothetical protein
MKVDVLKFCALSKREDFQSFLKSISSQYYDDLVVHLNKRHGCGENRKFMEKIYEKLKNDNKENLIIEFLKNTYPNMLIYDERLSENEKSSVVRTIQSTNPIVPNFHRVFPIYKPGMLLLPQKLILFDEDERKIYNKTILFIRKKISTDFIILKGDRYWHSYIEYFEPRFAEEADKIEKINRPIAMYRRAHDLK